VSPVGEFLEAVMMICFGISWPANIIKSWKTRSTRGKSLLFLVLVITGYLCGIIAKLAAGRINYVLVCYFINFFMVSADIALYIRNYRLDCSGANA